jgi:hypothetical protein
MLFQGICQELVESVRPLSSELEGSEDGLLLAVSGQRSAAAFDPLRPLGLL